MDTGAYMANQMDDLITSGLHQHGELEDDLARRMEQYILDKEYTWSFEAIVKFYIDYYTRGYYVSHSCKDIILKFEDDLKKLYPPKVKPQPENIPTKAYGVNMSRIEEGYLSDEIICHAHSASKARVILLKKLANSGWEHLNNGKEITYINIPLVRLPHYDLIDFEGQFLSALQIEEINMKRKRDDELDILLTDKSITHCYIKKGLDYYRENSRGYTESIIYAGVYTKKEAVSSARSVDSLRIIPIDIEYHNKRINEEILNLQKRIIKA